MKTIYDMTSGTLRKEIEEMTCEMQMSDICEPIQHTDCQLQEYTFDNVSAKTGTQATWLSGLEVEHFIDEMK